MMMIADQDQKELGKGKTRMIASSSSSSWSMMDIIFPV